MTCDVPEMQTVLLADNLGISEIAEKLIFQLCVCGGGELHWDKNVTLEELGKIGKV